jgi:hypothetical protein
MGPMPSVPSKLCSVVSVPRGVTGREYDLKAVGWARTVSGFQSLLSVYMLALWVLTYFGRPFG